MSKETTNYKLPRPEEEDFYNIEEYNHAIDVIDEALRSLKDSKLDKSGEASGLLQDEEHRFVTDAEKEMWNGKVSAAAGDISDTEIKRLTEAGERFPVPEAGENTKTFLGKVKKFIADFNDFKEGIITVGRLANNGKTTEAGFALDARYGKVLAEQVAGLSSELASEELTLGYDLNNAISKRQYRAVASNIVQSLVNAPSNLNGEVAVTWLPTDEKNTYGTQILTYTHGIVLKDVYIRNYSAAKGWSAWERFVKNSDLNTHKSSGDHDNRYYTEAEVDGKIDRLQKLICTEYTGDGSGRRVVPIKGFIVYNFLVKPAHDYRLYGGDGGIESYTVTAECNVSGERYYVVLFGVYK